MVRVQLSSLVGDTAKREVESTGVPQEVSALRGRVEVAEERLSMISDKSFRTLQEELNHLRSEVGPHRCLVLSMRAMGAIKHIQLARTNSNGTKCNEFDTSNGKIT